MGGILTVNRQNQNPCTNLCAGVERWQAAHCLAGVTPPILSLRLAPRQQRHESQDKQAYPGHCLRFNYDPGLVSGGVGGCCAPVPSSEVGGGSISDPLPLPRMIWIGAAARKRSLAVEAITQTVG